MRRLVRGPLGHLLFDLPLPPNGTANLPACLLRPKISGQSGGDMMLGIPDSHQLQLLYGRVVHSRFIDGIRALPYRHVQGSNWPLNYAPWSAERLYKLMPTKIYPLTGPEGPRD